MKIFNNKIFDRRLFCGFSKTSLNTDFTLIKQITNEYSINTKIEEI